MSELREGDTFITEGFGGHERSRYVGNANDIFPLSAANDPDTWGSLSPDELAWAGGRFGQSLTWDEYQKLRGEYRPPR